MRPARTAIASCLAALLAAACAGPVPRLAPPPDLSLADRDACETLARRARAQVQGDSVLGAAGRGGAAGTLVSAHALARANVSADSGDGLVLGAFVGSIVAIAAIVSAGVALVTNVSAGAAAHAEAMNACLRPALLARELGPEHPETGRSLQALAHHYYRQAELARAEPLLVRALAIQERSLGVDALEVATVLDDYAALLRRAGRDGEAEAAARRAEAIRRATR
jgi:hypothetical protein